ncbi:peptidase M15 [Arthrobacter sp. SW1]|uniref:M15 family metallopeptidase n=1 Tax=Arthrobacter sp. SW1 TaxID=1920889 RepID=UPI000877E243|nr:M15 family metallopeptidase [Arthrobacter sp. SW1]OFI40016.1 peptidase M15 [Arthrobacter sp. SW1]
MCENSAPDRRTFTAFLAASLGMAALSACTPQEPERAASTSGSPSASAGTSGRPTAAGTPSPTSAGQPAPSPVKGNPPATGALPPSASLPKQHSLSDPRSPWVVVNKHRPLTPLQFVPPDLVQPAVQLATSGESALLNSTTAAAAEKLFGAAASAGVTVTLASGYRSFDSQAATYNGYVSSRGQASADTASARPGFSEHQTGWAFDIGDGGGACSFQPCFAEQPAAVWVKANAHKYGFVVRYPWMLHETTGYYYEPWHLRYIGTEAAADMARRGITTLEEYFGTGAAPSYR